MITNKEVTDLIDVVAEYWKKNVKICDQSKPILELMLNCIALSDEEPIWQDERLIDSLEKMNSLFRLVFMAHVISQQPKKE